MRRSAPSGSVTISMSISAARTKLTRSARLPSFGTPRTTGGDRLSSRSSKMPQTRMSAPDATSVAITRAPRSPPPTMTARRSVRPKSIAAPARSAPSARAGRTKATTSNVATGAIPARTAVGRASTSSFVVPGQKRRSTGSR